MSIPLPAWKYTPTPTSPKSFGSGNKYLADFSIILTGDKELDRKLASIAPALQKKAIRQATRKSTKHVLDRAKELVPVKSGALRRSLKVRATKRSRVQQGHAIVSLGTEAMMRGKGIFEGDTYYGAFIELGTQHQAAQPFMRPALYESKNETLRVFRIELAIGIEKQRAKAAK